MSIRENWDSYEAVRRAVENVKEGDLTTVPCAISKIADQYKHEAGVEDFIKSLIKDHLKGRLVEISYNEDAISAWSSALEVLGNHDLCRAFDSAIKGAQKLSYLSSDIVIR